MTTDPNVSIAAALYGATPTPAPTAGAQYASTLTAAATPAATTARPLGAGPERAQAPTDDEVRAAVLFDGGNGAASPDAYSGGALASGFDAQEAQARFEGNAEDVELLGTARRQASGLMHAWQIPVPLARELTVALSAYSEALSDEALEAKSASTETELRAEWGSQYEANVAQARRVYKAALAKMPSLKNIIDAGGGSDATVIRAFYKAGKRRR